MIDSVKAIIWKEYKSASHRKKQIIINSICIFIFMTIISSGRLLNVKMTTENSEEIAKNMIIYVAVTGTYMGLLAVLRFWQEKSNHTIESLLSLPCGPITVILSKIIVPVVISIMIGLLDSILSVIVVSILYKKIIISIGVFVIPVIFGVAVGIPYCFINGYSMWCVSITYSKLVQGVSSLAYVAFIAVMFSNSSMLWTEILNVIFIGAVGLTVIALYLALKVKKENIVLNLLD
ncbi:hypothetical protein SAMN04487886_107014 [Clostridium sp. DSM 8431]|uniref:ABC transporter permease n=1 Tax=Clostridium sp. DSM 8431 TaxID=1761781 RepID=UPI0008F17AFA|nr:ABC transporter permease [Clostridium sp. DSM 8431]SFU59901.1 hypothetical protein SAMN04487886_107014 [Clostridium sp. DSM 8431]